MILIWKGWGSERTSDGYRSVKVVPPTAVDAGVAD